MTVRTTLVGLLRQWTVMTNAAPETPEAVADAYATEVETESWSRALDWVSETLELGVLTEGDATARKEELAKRLTAIVDRLTLGEQARDRVNALNAAGVDNWEGYGYAMRILHGEDEDD